MSWPQVKELSFWSVIFSYSMQQQWTISQLDCYVWRKLDFTWQPVMTSLSLLWLDWEDVSNNFPKINMHQNGVMVTAGGLLPIWSTTAFWILIKPLHQRSMLSKSMRCTETYNSWSWHWSTELAQFFSVTTHNHMLHNQSFKDWTNWATKFCLICHIHLTSQQSTTTSSSISTIFFCRENAYTTRRKQKMFPRVHWITKHKFLCYKRKQTYFSLAKMRWL